MTRAQTGLSSWVLKCDLILEDLEAQGSISSYPSVSPAFCAAES